MSATMRWLLTPMAVMAGLGLVLALAGDPRLLVLAVPASSVAAPAPGSLSR